MARHLEAREVRAPQTGSILTLLTGLFQIRRLLLLAALTALSVSAPGDSTRPLTAARGDGGVIYPRGDSGLLHLAAHPGTHYTDASSSDLVPAATGQQNKWITNLRA